MIEIFHNIMWPRYKAVIFSRLHELACARRRDVRFVQIAETERQRQALGAVARAAHAYPFELLFRGAYEDTPAVKMAWTLFRRVLASPAGFLVLPGYHRPEYWAMLFACLLRRTPRGVFCDSTLLDRPGSGWKAALKRFFFARCDGFFCYGARGREYLAAYGVDRAAIVTGCQAAALPDGFDAAAARAARAVDASSPRYLFVGRLAPEKGLDLLIDAFARVVAQRPTAALVLVGAGPQRDAAIAQSAALGLAGRVEFAGAKAADELAAEFARATCLVLPSRSEPWGLVVNEALSHGCPVVVSNVCGCVPELVVDGVTGFVFESGDVAALAARLEQVARLGPVAEVAVACQRLIAQYSPEAAAARILDGCERFLDRSHAGVDRRSDARAAG